MNLEHQKIFDAVTNVEVTVYKTLHLRANGSFVTDAAHAAESFIELNKYPDEAIEKFVNHIHVCDLFPDLPEDEYSDIADKIACAWEKELSALDLRYRVPRYEGYGPEVTFYLDRTLVGTLGG